MANIGTTIAPWMIFFQQSAVVDKGMQEKDMTWGKLDTAFGSVLTVVVAAGCIVLTATLLSGQNINDAATAAILFMGINKHVGTFLAIGLFDAGLLGAICISLASSWAFGEVFGWAHSLNNNSGSALVLCLLLFHPAAGGHGGADSGRAPGADHAFCAGDRGDVAARGFGLSHPAAE